MAAPRGSEVWRDYVTDGIPSSGANKPKKSDIRSWSSWLESMVTSGVLSSGPWFATKAAMTLGYVANTVAVVYNDPTAANNGLYIKSGASGSGSWTQLTSFLPGYQFVTASPTGASTANAIVATTSPRLPAGDGVALVTLAIPATNTASPVTVGFDGGAVLTIKTRTGEDPDAGELQQNDVVAGFVSGATFRLISDLNSLRNYQSAKAWANNDEDVPVPASLGGDGVTTFSAKHWAAKSEEDADRSYDEAERAHNEANNAETSAGVAAAIVNDIASEKEVPIVGVVEALPSLDLPVGMTAIRTNGFSTMGDGGAWPLVVEIPNLVAETLLPWQRFTNGGTRRWELRTTRASVKMFGARGDGVTDDTQAIQNGNDYLASRGGGTLEYPQGTFVVSYRAMSGNARVGIMQSSKVMHEGAGQAATTLFLANGADCHIFFSRNLVDGGACHMRLAGNRANQSPPEFDGHDPSCILIADTATRVNFHHLTLDDALDYALGIELGWIIDSSFDDITINNAGADGIDQKNTLIVSTNNRMRNITVNSFGMQGETGEIFAGVDLRGQWQIDNIRINNLGLGKGNASGRDGVRWNNSGSTDPGTGGGANSTATNIFISGYRTDYANDASVQGLNIRDRNILICNYHIENVGRGTVRGQRNVMLLNGFITGCRRGFVDDSTLTHAGNPLPTYPVYGGISNLVIRDCTEIGLRLEANVVGNTYSGVVIDNCGVNISMAGTASKNTFIGGASINGTTIYTGGDGTNKFIGVAGIVGLTKTMSANIPVDSVGTKTFTINHGLTAGTGSISAIVQEYSGTAVGDYRAEARISAITSTQVTVEVLVSVASATAGAYIRYEVTASKNQ